MNIILCGFMGSGKTTIGKALSKRLNMRFIDLDDYIVEKRKMDIQYIFKMYGEENFRKSETQAAKNISKMDNCIISLGGGTVINQKNVEILKTNGVIVFLNISANEVYKRLKHNNSRPLLQTNDKLTKIKEMLSSRMPYYQKAADFTVNADNCTPAEATKKVLEILNNNKII